MTKAELDARLLLSVRFTSTLHCCFDPRVEANIQATSITLAGQVKGNPAKGDVSLLADSRLDGNIRAYNVEVGGVVKGNIMGKGKVELGPALGLRATSLRRLSRSPTGQCS